MHATFARGPRQFSESPTETTLGRWREKRESESGET